MALSRQSGTDARRDPSALADEVLALSRVASHSIWSADADTLLSLFDENIAFAGTYSRTYIYGKKPVLQEILDAVTSRGRPGAFEIRDERYNVKPLGSDSCLATAQYSLLSSRDGGPRRLATFVSSLVWVRANNAYGWAMLLCHTSERVIMRSQTLAGGDSSERIALHAHDNAGTTYWVQPAEVVYIKAARQYTEVHCTDRCLRLRGPFTGVLESLAQTVTKVHRSYAVNPAYVERLEGEMLYLKTGEKLPVPARRVTQVRTLLSGTSSATE